MRGAILDADSLGPGDLDLSPVTDLLDEWTLYPVTRPHELIDRLQDVDVVLTNKIPLSQETFDGAPSVKFVSILATGFNHIDLDAARSAGVVVSNATRYATGSVVQHTVSLMLALSNNLLRYVEDVRNGRWQQADVFCFLDHRITELAGKRLGIIGYGELGSNVAAVARALGMEVLVSARPGTKPEGDRIAFDELLGRVDYLSLHCPLTEETNQLINAAALARMQPHAFLINTSRGGLVDSDALVAALQDGEIAGAGLDVLPTEPPPADDVLLGARLPNLLITPHSAWGAIETRQRLMEQTRENIESFLAGSPVRELT